MSDNDNQAKVIRFRPKNPADLPGIIIEVPATIVVKPDKKDVPPDPPKDPPKTDPPKTDPSKDPPKAEPPKPPLKPEPKKEGHLMTWEHTRTGILFVAVFASILFGLFEIGVYEKVVHVDPSCTVYGIESCATAGIELAIACVLYHALCMAGLLARRPAQIGWEFALIFVGWFPLFVLMYWTFFHWSELTGFRGWATLVFWLIEGVDLVEVALAMLQLTRRSSIGFGVVDDAGHRM